MSKHTTNSGSTGFRWLRSLLAFRHRNPVARFVSTVLAFAMATLLVVGTGVAYGDGTTPTDTTTPAADTSTPTADPTSTADPAPTSDPAPTTAPAPTTTSATTTTSTSTTTSSPKTTTSLAPATTTLKKVTPGSVINGITVPCDYTASGAANVPTGSFEIDGNTCLTGDTLTGSIDWDTVDFSTDAADQQNDGFNDSTTFTQGDSENNDPSTWHINGPTPNGKTDIGTAMAYSQISGGKVYGYFAFTNSSTSGGTQQYDVEYNQNDATLNGNGALVPVRSEGDLLFRFHSTGAAPLVYDDAKIYRYQSNPLWSDASCFAVNSSSPAGGWCTLSSASSSAFTMKSSADGLFQEGAIDISSFFPVGTCSGDFSTTQLRSVTGNSFATSALKDYVHPLAVHTPSTCGKLVIKKTDAAGDPTNPTLVGGAVFKIAGDPRPGADNTKTLCIYDGPASSLPTKPAGCDSYIADGTADGIITIDPVEPGTYTVTEIVPPPGYMLAPNPPGNTQTVTVGDSETKTLTYSNYKIWKGLTAVKTANPTYRAQYAWSINKEISLDGTTGWTTSTTAASPLVKNTAFAADNSLFYRVTVTEGARTTSQYKVSGKITVSNPADNVGSMDAVVTDALPGATCLVDGGASKSITVAKGASVDVPYVCTFAGTPAANQLAGTNSATVTWDRSTYPQVVGDLTDVGGTTREVDPTAAYDFANAAVTEVDKTVTVTDNKHTFVPAWTITWSAQGTAHTSAVYTQTPTVAAGSCSDVFDNTATVTGDTSGVLGTDSAYGKVCVGANLSVTKNKTVSMTRTYLWQIHKTRTSAASILSGQSASYSVTVDHAAGAGYTDSGWAMTGVITVTNPNTWEPVTMSGIVDHYSGDNDATNSCTIVSSRPAGTTTWGAVDLTLQKNAAGLINSRDYKYTCTFVTQPDYGTVAAPEVNTATASWDGAAASTPSSNASGTVNVTDADWTLSATPVNKVITVVDNQYTGGTGTGGHVLGTLDWDNAPHTYTYSMPWTAPAGTCVDKPNTASIVETKQDSSATVEVCNPLDLSVSKTATGSYTRTYKWDLLKTIVGSAIFTGDSYNHTFDYLVSLKENGVQDSAWKVDGTITVTNSNTDTGIPAYTASVTDAMTGVGGSPTCQWKADGDPSATWAAFPGSVTVASGQAKVLDYTCSFATQPTYSGGTNKATATWTGGSASSNDVPVSFAETTSIDKTVKVTDDKTSGTQAELPNSPVTYGSHGTNAAWVAADSAYEFPYSLPLSYDTGSYTPPACESFPNTAKVLGHGDTVLDTATATAQICPTVGTWTVAKDVAEPLAVPVGTTLHYTLTAHKTSVVDAKNVVLHDDLSDLAPYITGDPVFTAPAGTTVGYNTTTHVLTWTIPTLGSTDRTLGFTVTVASNAYNVDLPNLVTSPGSSNCPDADHVVAACQTDNKTPHYTLRKSSDEAGQTVLPPYYGQAQGTLITYTLTVHNDSQVPINSTTMPGAQVTDNLSDVLDNATWVGNLTPAGQAVFDGDHTLTWTLPTIAAGADATLTYQVRVNADQWNQTLTNVATPGSGGDCVPVPALVAPLVNPNCTTTSTTPGYGMLEALKVDAETQLPLAGATFALYQGTDTEADPLATATSQADGTALFNVKLRPGDFTIVETAPPAGYTLPTAGGDVQHVTLTESDMDNGDPATVVTFGDPPTGALSIAKAHQELVGGVWVPSDGTIAFNDQVKYVLSVAATGTRVFHDVTVTDYVPGYNPADTQTQLGGFKGVLDTGSVTCSGELTCTSSYDSATGLITWHLTGTGQETGDLSGQSGTVSFIVRMPDLPRISPLAGPGVSFAGLMWNQGYLSWTQAGDEGPRTLASNQVTDAASEVLPPQQVSPPKQHHPAVLPNTGGPNRWLPAAGLALLLAGAGLVAGDRRRRHRG